MDALEQIQQQTTLVVWPTPQDYNEAVQSPDFCFSDEELKASQPELNMMGLPRPVSGNFATVYRLNSRGQTWALRCFLHRVDDDHVNLYKEIGEYLHKVSLPCMLPFDYVQKGIRIGGRWYPVLKMAWAEGPTLGAYIHANYANRSSMKVLQSSFVALANELRVAGIAHGDLQHANIIVQNNGENLRVVDYDGMFVPAFAGSMASELGHRNYQHPGRNAVHFANYLDNFSAWLIHESLELLIEDRTLYKRFGNGDECILFKEADLQDPTNSELFRTICHHQSETVRAIGRRLLALLATPIDQVPALGEQVVEPDSISDIPVPSSISTTVPLVVPVSAQPVNTVAPFVARDITPKRKSLNWRTILLSVICGFGVVVAAVVNFERARIPEKVDSPALKQAHAFKAEADAIVFRAWYGSGARTHAHAEDWIDALYAYDMAIERFKGEAEHTEDIAFCYLGRSRCLYQLGDMKNAQNAIDLALKYVSPSSPNVAVLQAQRLKWAYLDGQYRQVLNLSQLLPPSWPNAGPYPQLSERIGVSIARCMENQPTLNDQDALNAVIKHFSKDPESLNAVARVVKTQAEAAQYRQEPAKAVALWRTASQLYEQLPNQQFALKECRAHISN